jgi:hypothetical protein
MPYRRKHSILTLGIFLFCTTLFAQEAKPCLFIGTFEKNKRGICGDYELVHEEVADYAEFVIKRIAFQKEHSTLSPNTKFIHANESVIAYQYEKKISGWGCNSTVISTKTGKSIEECNKQLTDHLAKNPKDFTTPPKTIFSWQGKNNVTAVYTKDFGGLTGKFTATNTGSKSFVVAQLSNNTAEMIAYVLLKTDSGAETVEYINPGATLTKKYYTKNLELKVVYLDRKKPKPTVDFIKAMKNQVRETLINENGKIRPMPTPTTTGVRG